MTYHIHLTFGRGVWATRIANARKLRVGHDDHGKIIGGWFHATCGNLEEDVEVCDEGFLGAKMGDKVTVLEESPGDAKARCASDANSTFFQGTPMEIFLPAIMKIWKIHEHPAFEYKHMGNP